MSDVSERLAGFELRPLKQRMDSQLRGRSTVIATPVRASVALVSPEAGTLIAAQPLHLLFLSLPVFRVVDQSMSEHQRVDLAR